MVIGIIALKSPYWGMAVNLAASLRLGGYDGNITVVTDSPGDCAQVFTRVITIERGKNPFDEKINLFNVLGAPCIQIDADAIFNYRKHTWAEFMSTIPDSGIAMGHYPPVATITGGSDFSSSFIFYCKEGRKRMKEAAKIHVHEAFDEIAINKAVEGVCQTIAGITHITRGHVLPRETLDTSFILCFTGKQDVGTMRTYNYYAEDAGKYSGRKFMLHK